MARRSQRARMLRGRREEIQEREIKELTPQDREVQFRMGVSDIAAKLEALTTLMNHLDQDVAYVLRLGERV